MPASLSGSSTRGSPEFLAYFEGELEQAIETKADVVRRRDRRAVLVSSPGAGVPDSVPGGQVTDNGRGETAHLDVRVAQCPTGRCSAELTVRLIHPT